MPHDPLGKRMKCYERAAEAVLAPRLPVIIRLDGNSFSRLTRKLRFNKPFDERFERAMNEAARAVLEYCDGAVLGFVQSDEIHILLRNDHTPATQPFLGGRTQKIASLTAACASVAFVKALAREGIETMASFDARVFTVPPSEVNNVFLWRQLDCFRNCVSSVAYWGLAGKYGRGTARRMLHGKSTKEQQEIIFTALSINVNDLPVHWRRGRVLRRVKRTVLVKDVLGPERYQQLLEGGFVKDGQTTVRSSWEVDLEPPCFNVVPEYIENLYQGKELPVL